MGCPVHIWAPLMGSMVPLARLARDRLRWPAKSSAAPAGASARPPLRRFRPVWSQPTPDRSPDP